jgi:hypothetical protein
MKHRDYAALHFRHFGMRLIERYGLFITFDYYMLLCKIKPEECKPKKNSPHPVDVGYLKVHDQRVKVLKDTTRHKLLLTALPL